MISNASNTIYGTVRGGWPPDATWDLVWPNNIEDVIYAHTISGDQSYIDALEQTYQFALGANPKNLVYTSGLGVRSIAPYDHAWETGYSEEPAAGLSSIGYNDPWQGDTDAMKLSFSETVQMHCRPQIIDWPDAETYFEKIKPSINEYTVHSSMAYAMHGWGYLAQHYNVYGSVRVKPQTGHTTLSTPHLRGLTIQGTAFRVTLTRAAKVRVSLYDISGRCVWNGTYTLGKGSHTKKLDSRQRPIAPGAYVLSATSNGDRLVRSALIGLQKPR
jgi:hypothetical protein